MRALIAWLSRRSHHLEESARSAVFIAALAMIAEDQVGWIRAINGYAFATIANLTANSAHPPEGGDNARIVVLALDQAAYDTKYAARSPLDRCALRDDVLRVYAAGPKLLVIDFDLSPALWLNTGGHRPDVPEDERTKQKGCEQALYALIKQHGTRTVLMEPFAVEIPATEARKHIVRLTRDWQDDMRDAQVRFGAIEIPIDYGLAIRSRVDRHSIVGAARLALNEKPGTLHTDPTWINPAQMRRGVHGAKLDGDLRALYGRVVFFGGTWDAPAGDTYLTPVGDLYGVEFHAGAFASTEQRISTSGWRDLSFDVLLALLFGFMAAASWRRYFSEMQRPDVGEYGAAFWVFRLGAAFVGLVAGFLVVSFWLLRFWGIWASPIPIAMGVALESFVLKSVEEAKRLLKHQVPVPVTAIASGEEMRGGFWRRWRIIVFAAGNETGRAPRKPIWWKWVVVSVAVVIALYLHWH